MYYKICAIIYNMLRKTAPALIVVTIGLGILLGVVAFASFQRLKSTFARGPLAKPAPALSNKTSTNNALSPFSDSEQKRLDDYQKKISQEFLEIENSDEWQNASNQQKKQIFSRFLGSDKNVSDYYDLNKRAELWAKNNYPPAPEMPAQNEASFIRPAFIILDNKNTISADFVQWLGDTLSAPDDTAPVIPSHFATLACLEDDACITPPCEYEITKSPCIPNGYYLKNHDSTTVPYTLNASTIIELPTLDDITKLEKVTLAQFVDRMKQANEVPAIHPLFSLEVKNNQLISLSWIYTP